MYITNQFQREGIGTKLFSFAVNELKIQWLWVLEYNEHGIAFYEKNGFRRTGERFLEDGWIPLVKFEKE